MPLMINLRNNIKMRRTSFKGVIIFLGLTLCYVLGEADLGLDTTKPKILDGKNVPNNPTRHAVKSIQSEDGDIIDCIDIYKQPSLDHPSLKNHIIQLAPSYNPNMEEIQTSEQPFRSVTSQVWQKSGSCPKGTIPVVRRRTHNDDELLSNSRKKSPLTVHQRNHSKAILLTEGYNYAGVKADIKVWNPRVESDDEYSTSRISLRSGPWYDFESVEAGWAVNPSVYGDRQTRLFAYWTVDASKKTGCFDLTCPGFVQTSHEIALGAAIYPISVFRGLPYQITLFIFKDPNTNNLWVQYGERTNIGYWPPKLFKTLTYGAECAEWGGDVYSSKLEQVPHTETQMGNGNFPDYIDGNSGYMKRMRILDISLNLKFPEWVGTYADEYWCYQSQYVSDYVSEDGDIIDCVEIYKQPAFDHPALRNHVIQVKPSFDLKEVKINSKNESSKLTVFQTWQKSGSCPEGTVSIRRIRREDLLRANSVQQFGRKPQEVVLKSNTTIEHKDGQSPFFNNTKFTMPTIVNRSAATLVTVGYNYIGAKADINVWNPNVESEDEFTTAQMWLKAGPGDNFESLESGWMVNPQLYGDKKTRFFAHWTKDSYKTTGCFDLHCSGFVQTSSKVAFGGALEPVSTEFGEQYYINVGIFMDPKTNNWWLKIKEDLVIGYWPASTLLFYLNHSSTLVEWGGQVYSSNVKKKPHTKTGMGSGQFASGLRGNACYMDNIAIVDFSMQLKYPQRVGTWADEQYCYTALNYQEGYGKLPIFYFGGPGQNYNCP
ncbi:hypothetical protein J1N35_009199 [Gossypium stocksii]|uniref:Neprosin PEP catalytic domain-containing protein n=1 Tax=Gossypium stocksii TaxID=47602 RepID=A0A9D3VXX0_9ROSI|nr:hypothetical protein J1N35_009199 [Gossypium stocksii]